MVTLTDALHILGIADPGDDLLYAIETLNELVRDNDRHTAEGRLHLVNEDYGHDLNELAARLGIPYHVS
jgi:hypothetical protein